MRKGGFIPARAGKTARRGEAFGDRRVHPRAGGENRVTWQNRILRLGSSPRGRGKRQRDEQQRNRPGFIPARAGKTQSIRAWRRGRTVHPRAGGENMTPRRTSYGGPGSSPRGRGKHGGDSLPDGVPGFIPARAGKTAIHGHCGCPFRVHPRAGGENAIAQPEGQSAPGSSPRGRGKLAAPGGCGGYRGFIPARAGKTAASAASGKLTKVHPRAGGENLSRSSLTFVSWGSSPRGRGKQRVGTAAADMVGFIPARAGKTRASSTPLRASAVHPRAGGENNSGPTRRSARMGSSPRGRGKRCGSHDQPPCLRFIPARAGKTLSDLRFYRADRSDLGNP